MKAPSIYDMTMKNISPYGHGRILKAYPRISERSRTPIYGVKQLPATERYRLPLLVTGNGRSGTTWLAKTFEKTKVIGCPHEHCGDHGTVSWYFFADSDWHPFHVSHRPVGRVIHVGERRSDFNFQWTVHLVRDPLKVIGSMVRVMSMTDHWYAVCNSLGRYSQDLYYDRKASRMLKTMHMAYAIWKMSEQQADFTIRLEDVPKRWPDLMTMVGHPRDLPMPQVEPTNKSSGIYKALKLHWNQLSIEDERLAQSIYKLSEKFGY